MSIGRRIDKKVVVHTHNGMLSFKPTFLLSSFTFIKRLFSSSLSAIRVVSSVYLKVKVKSLSRVRLFATPWTVAYQAPLPMGFSRQEYWSGLPFPSPGDLPDPGIEPGSSAFQADALTSEPPGKPLYIWGYCYFSKQSSFQFVFHPVQNFSWCTLHIS